MMQHTKTLRRFCDALCAWVESISMGFLGKGSSKNCVIVKIVFFPPLLQTYSQKMGQKFSFLSDDAYFKCT